MVVRTRPPQTPVMPRSVASAPRRWPKRLAVALIVLLVGAAIGAHLYLRAYEPLTLGSGSYGIWPHRMLVDQFDAQGWGDGGFTQSYVRWAKGETVHMQFPLWNDGPLPVTVDGITGSQTDRLSPVSVTIVGTGPVDGRDAGQMTSGFAPFTLQPGDGVQVFVDVTMTRRVDRASDVGVNTVQLSYRAGWVPHRITMFMGQSVSLCGGTCPP